MKITRLGVIWLVLACLLGIAEQWLTVSGYGLWRLGAAGLLLCLLYEWLLVRAQPVELVVPPPDRIKLGRETPLVIHLTNRTSRILRIEMAPDLQQGVVATPAFLALTIGPRATEHVTFHLLGRATGTLTWPKLPARVCGVLGLSWWPLKLSPDVLLTVIPHRRGGSYELFDNRVVGDRAVTVGAGLELHRLREYQPGDPLRSVNWKASARTGKMVTTVFSEEQHLEVILLLDLGRTCRTEVDGVSQCAHYINLASDFAGLAISSGDYVGLVTTPDFEGLTVPPARGQRGLVAIDAALGRVAPTSEDSNLPEAALKALAMARNRSLVLILTDLYGQDYGGGFGRSLALLSRRHICLVVGMLGRNVSALAESAQVDTAGAYAGLAASEYQASIRANVDAARRLGASAVLSSPADAARRVMREYRVLKTRRQI